MSAAMRSFRAGDIFFSNSTWMIKSTVSIRTLDEMLSWNDGGHLALHECLEIYNQWITPIWNALCSEINCSPRNTEPDVDKIIANNQKEFLELFWIIKSCLLIPELNFGVTLKTTNKIR